MTTLSPLLRYPLAAAYLYGAAVHLANMASLRGFDWSAAPLRWQTLDLVYLVLDVVVVIGLLVALRVGLVAFAVAAISQILLYTVFRDWVLDVPPALAPTPAQRAWLDTLVTFHVVSLVLVAFDVARRHRRAAAASLPSLAVAAVAVTLLVGCGDGGDAYDVVGDELIVRSAVGEVETYALRRDGERVVGIDDRAAVPVTAVDAATLVGGWSNVSYRQIGCRGLGFCRATLTERQLAFSAEGRFFRRAASDSTTALEGLPGSGLGSGYAFVSRDSGLVGEYSVRGNELMLRFDNGRVVHELVSRPDTATVAVGNLAYASDRAETGGLAPSRAARSRRLHRTERALLPAGTAPVPAPP